MFMRIFRSRRLAFFTFAWVSVASWSTHAFAAEDLDALMRHFDNVAFGSEYEGVAPATQTQKWVSPIRISVSGMTGEMLQKPDGKRELKLSRARPTEPQIALIRKHLTTLVKLTGVESEKADRDKGKPANLYIKFVPRLVMGQPFIADDVEPDLLKKLGQPGVCYFLTRAIRTGALFRGLIVVNRELPPEQMDACLLEEMTQAMGLPNDSDIVAPSIFNQTSTLRALTETDIYLLRTLYDKRLPPGTPRVDALRIGREIMSELLAGR